MGTRRPLAALLLALALLAAGCGGDGDEKNAYVRQVQDAQRAYAEAFEAVTTKLTAKSTAAEDRATLRRFDTATGDFVQRLEDADVPEDVSEEHAELTRTLVDYRGAIGRAAEGLDEDARAARAGLAKSTDVTRRGIARSIVEINDALGA